MKKEEFLEGFSNATNHRALLWKALKATTGDVVELGMGHGSTPYLHDYCLQSKRLLYSFDNDGEWMDKNITWMKRLPTYSDMFHRFINVFSNWDIAYETIANPDVILIDHAPGDRRHIDVKKYADSAKIIVIHDSEPAATGYMMDKIWGLFKYRKDFESPGAWATAVSNHIDVSKW